MQSSGMRNHPCFFIQIDCNTTFSLLDVCTVCVCLLYASFYCIKLYTAPTETPLNVSVDVETSRNITLSWERPSLEKQNGILTMYHVIIMETQILYLDNGTTITRMGDNFNRTYNVSEGRVQLVDALHPSYNYTVRIAAATAAGIGPFSDLITVMTLEDGKYT